MSSITALSCIALLAGFGLSVLIGAKSDAANPIGCIGSALSAASLGTALSFAAGISHAFCEQALRLCAPTTDTTVWSVSYPLMAVPIYWLIIFFRSLPPVTPPIESPTREDEANKN
jgi:hypothetical protein